MPAVEFGSTAAIETLLRAAVVFKFEGGEEAKMYAGSPQFAHSVSQLLAGVVEEHRRTGREGIAQRWESLYELSGHHERRSFVREYARRHPDWSSLSEEDRRAWVDVVAAPYRVSEGDFAYVTA